MRLLVTAMRQSAMERVLCAGNGISMEPRALAAAGFEVVALDLSAYALEVANRFPPSNELLSRFIDPNMLRTGGSVDLVVGNVLDPEIAPGPFDVVIERRAAQAYQVEAENRFMQRLAARLSDEGILFSHVHDGGWRPGQELRHATRAWFEARRWPIWSGQGTKPPGRVGWTFLSTG